MLSRIQARIVEFFRRPAVQSVVRHVAVTAGSAAFAYVAVHGVAGVVTAAGAAALVRAVWVAVRPQVEAEAEAAVESVAGDAGPAIPQTAAAAPPAEAPAAP